MGYCRSFYRTHLARYVLFRHLKRLGLAMWWPLRNMAFAMKTLARPRLFYRTYLAQYRVFHLLKTCLLSIYFRFPAVSARLFQLRRPARTFHLISMRDFVTKQAIGPIVVESSKKIQISGPKFVGRYPIKIHYVETVSLDTPAIEVMEISDATVVGGTNLILSGAWAIHPDLLVPSRDVMPAETYGIATVALDRGEIKVRLSRRRKTSARAISLLGQCTGNYAHWLTETLPKLLFVDAIEEFDGLPLLVDGWIHPTFRTTIDLLSKKKRTIINVERWEAVLVSSVIEVSPPAYVPPEFRSYVGGVGIPVPSPRYFPFSLKALEMLRSAAWGVAASASPTNGSRKLYILRPPESVGNQRFISNIEDVERLILANGFEPIDPAKLSIAEQIAVFRDARCIISPVGAALANTIFTPAGCKVIALAPYYENANYYYFSNLMGVLGHDLHYVLGPQVEKGGHALHRDYAIDLVALAEALERLEEPTSRMIDGEGAVSLAGAGYEQ